jgi:Transposase IS66 family
MQLCNWRSREAREAGVDISRAMCGWVMRVGEMLEPVVGAMRKELLAGSYIQADETPVDVQTHDKRGKNHQAYLWQYGTPGGATVFDFRMSRGREGPARFLGQFEGILQTSGREQPDLHSSANACLRRLPQVSRDTADNELSTLSLNSKQRNRTFPTAAASCTRPWLPSGSGCRDRRLSRY